MSVLVKILMLSFCLLIGSKEVPAQASTVMRVSLNVVSGSSITGMNSIEINSAESSTDLNPALTIESSPNAEVLVLHNKLIEAANEFGKNIIIDARGGLNTDAEKGRYSLLVQPTLPAEKSFQGNYQGTLYTTIEYL